MHNISIIIPFYNAENTIERALASFISNKNFIKEVILVNDRSTDNTISKIENFKKFFNIKILDNQGAKGPGPARKTGILAATGDWITFVDADDCLTPNSLYYVNKQITNNIECFLLHTQTIYYESGTFISDNVEYCDVSCGGNFYKREYLINNNLFPHDELFMAEDEYFNNIVIKHIQLYGNENKNRYWYNYPTYEVHHDSDERKSFAHSNWGEYLCKYHLLSSMYYVDFFIKDNKAQMVNDLLNSIIFAFYLYEGLKADPNIEFNEEEALLTFVTVVKYAATNFGIGISDMVKYFNNNTNLVNSIYESAVVSIGIRFEKKFSFRTFLQVLFDYNG